MSAYHRPQTLTDALAVLSDTRVTLAAGCTDLFAMTEAQELPGPVLDLTAVPDLRGVHATADGWRIGATTTWSEIIAADLPPAFDMLKQAGHEVGSVQIQNAGTVAGNLCNASPAADGVPPLLALNALVEVSSQTGQRVVPLERFITGVRQTILQPDEIVSAALIPPTAGQGVSRFLKLGARKYLVISIAMVAVRLVQEHGLVREIALSVGACSAVALRLTAIEQRLIGHPVSALADLVNVQDLAPVLSPITDIRGDDAYRITAATELLRRALNDVAMPHKGAA